MVAFYKGVFMGLTITVSLGPGFMALFQTSILKGYKAGMILATGILISDLLLILISYLGMSQINHQDNSLILGLVAGAILIGTGTISFFRKTDSYLAELNQSPNFKKSVPSLLLKGFLLNVANPFCLMFWIGILGFAAQSYTLKSPRFFSFFIGLLITAYSSDLLKCYLSETLRKYFNKNSINILNKIIGVALFIIGIIVIYKVIA